MTNTKTELKKTKIQLTSDVETMKSQIRYLLINREDIGDRFIIILGHWAITIHERIVIPRGIQD